MTTIKLEIGDVRGDSCEGCTYERSVYCHFHDGAEFYEMRDFHINNTRFPACIAAEIKQEKGKL